MALDVHDQPLELEPASPRRRGSRGSAGRGVLSRASRALRSRNAEPPRAASQPSSEPAASPTSASRTPAIRCRTSQRQLPSGIPGRRGASRAWSRDCSAAGRPGGTVGHRRPPQAGDIECDPGHGYPQPRVGVGETVPCSITCVPPAPPTTTGSRRPSWPGCSGWRWSALALVLFAGTAVVALAGLPLDLLVALVLVGVLGCVALGWWLRAGPGCCAAPTTATGSGWSAAPACSEARWSAGRGRGRRRTAATSPACELRLRDGRTTTIPVGVLAVGPRASSCATLQGRLQRGHGLRPL